MDRLRATWWTRQGLGSVSPIPPAEVTKRFGWLRSVGSANPYVAIHTRTGASRAEIEKSVETTELVEVPAARGCTYYVPREDAALALALARTGSCAAEFRMAERHLGVTEEEVRDLADTIARALENGPLDPRAISAAVSPRHLGDAGKKRGMTSTLSLGLSRLQIDGRIRRLPQGGRLDTERFRYTLWENGPRPSEMDDAEVAQEMGRRYFRWAGPATEKEFREFTGLSAKLAKEGMVGLCQDSEDPLRFDAMVVEGPEVQADRVVLLASLDPWLHLRRNLPTLLDPADDARRIPYGNDLADPSSLRDLDSHPIVQGGVVVGLWEFDHDVQEIAAWCWRPSESVEMAVRETGDWIARELGDFRSFSLDSPASRRKRIERLRSF